MMKWLVLKIWIEWVDEDDRRSKKRQDNLVTVHALDMDNEIKVLGEALMKLYCILYNSTDSRDPHAHMEIKEFSSEKLLGKTQRIRLDGGAIARVTEIDPPDFPSREWFIRETEWTIEMSDGRKRRALWRKIERLHQKLFYEEKLNTKEEMLLERALRLAEILDGNEWDKAFNYRHGDFREEFLDSAKKHQKAMSRKG